MKEQTLVEYLKQHKFESVFVVSTPEHDSKRARVIDLIQDTLGVKAVPGIMEFDAARSSIGRPNYKVTDINGKADRKLLFTSNLTLSITDGYPQVIRVDLKYGDSVGKRFTE
ncbi:hypothetical protein pETSU_210 [Edwardsiella phage pEt-SU]|uniref:Uncharacterized protein n=1 Tax=Edwardsiella phage pEt-SU TaxID=2562142 RepID=A0A4D6DWQ8_9CAUD|nr:hypothetical protein HOV39_gp210 [Edwardsiella phage pEt-SU]QBZ70791.1 hypothetical protein pETSU_210 [Edwardsiella phage pEt-SU]